MLGLILAVGNAMNAGTAYGGARGFFLDSLLRMASVKATSAGTAAGGSRSNGGRALNPLPSSTPNSPPAWPVLCADKRNLSLLHYTVTALADQDEGALGLPEDLPSLETAAAVEYEVMVTNGLRDLHNAVRRVASASPPITRPAFVHRYPYLRDVSPTVGRVAVRVTLGCEVCWAAVEAPPGAPGGATAEDIVRGRLPAACGRQVGAGRRMAHANHTFVIAIDKLEPGRSHTVYLAVRDVLDEWLDEGDDAWAGACEGPPLRFFTLPQSQADPGSPGRANRATAGAAAAAVAAMTTAPSAAAEGEEDERAERPVGTRADYKAKLNDLLSRRVDAGAKPLAGPRRPPAPLLRAGSSRLADLAMPAAAPAAALELVAPEPQGPVVRGGDDDEDDRAARVQVRSFVRAARPRLCELDALHEEVQGALLDLGRYFGEPKSKPSEVFEMLSTIKEFVAEFTKVKATVLDQRQRQRRSVQLPRGRSPSSGDGPVRRASAT